MATHSSIADWEISWTEEPGKLQSVGLQRAGHDWSHTHTSYAHIAGCLARWVLWVLWPCNNTKLTAHVRFDWRHGKEKKARNTRWEISVSEGKEMDAKATERRESVINWCTGLLGLPQTEWLKPQKLIFSQLGSLEVQGQDVSRGSFSRGFSSWLTRDSLYMVFPLSICVLISFSYKSHWIRIYPDNDFISTYLFEKSSVQIHSLKHQALGFQHTNFGGDAF